MKRQGGITLIALVITIIVLLILAGVSIASIVGENGIINKAREAREATAEAAAREILSRNLLDLQTNYVTQGKSLKISQEMADDLAKYSDIDSATFLEKKIKVVIGDYTFDLTDNLVIGDSSSLAEIVEPENIDDWVVDYDTIPGYAIIIGYVGDETEIVIPNQIDGVKVIQIGTGDPILEVEVESSEYSYEYDYSYTTTSTTVLPVTKVVISEGIEIIGDYAFQNTTDLNTVVLPASLETIGKYAFSGSGLTNITIPSGVKTIGAYAFYNCSNLSTVVLAEGLETIESYAFKNCPITDVVIPDTVTTVGSYIFTRGNVTIAGTTIDLTSETFSDVNLTILESNPKYSQDDYCIYNKAKTILYYFNGEATEYIMPNTVETLYDDTMFAYSSIEKIKLSESLTEIAPEAFKGCVSLRKVEFSDNITKIGTYAFSGCDLDELELPKNLENIEEYAFANVSINSGELIIPASVKTIGMHAFFGCGLTKLTIESDVLESIGELAFYGNDIGGTITIPESVIFMGGYVFSYNSDDLVINVLGYSSKPEGWSNYWDYTELTSTTNWERVTVVYAQ